ncbi:lipoprotein-anchoring transpeptidase ErfK/SrfK [Rhizobium paranaense]|uniref:Lipoprotein-anchoring transpeptidase ErfK/SrfK n=2 Tax=Rhizobium/Agrobacterium group TaxID=227290 RepID=A0A7W9CZB1_9HYPH|nr:lipoprotein-anchoring transpeptidase ErfK/SrfK [Rhizobium paranaense]
MPQYLRLRRQVRASRAGHHVVDRSVFNWFPMMADLLPASRRLLAVAALAALSGCSIIPDTGATDPDRFAQETAPIFYQPEGIDPQKVGRLPVQPVPQARDLFRSQFNQTYGLPTSNPVHQAMYAQKSEDDFTLPAIPYKRIDPRFLRQEVDYRTNERPGTIVIDTRGHYLYFVEPGGRAMRYGVGLGAAGYAWHGRGVIQWKQKWPRWTPPSEMVAREPEIKPVSAQRGGMNPGPTNPLGARALYIFQNGRDTLYRIHGTPDWQSIGKQASSGCVRMLNQDVIDLFNRVSAKAEVVVQ